LAVAQDEYDQELAHRRDAETEVGRLRLKVSAQNATIDAMAADHRKRENLAKMEKDMVENLQSLERELSKLRAEREMTLAEMEELNATKKSVNIRPWYSGTDYWYTERWPPQKPLNFRVH